MKKVIIALMLCVCLALGGAVIYMKSSEDKEAPKIKIPDNDITYTQGESYDKLLENVTAMDNRDGDVTESLVIEEVYPNNEGTQATVMYAARDKNNNVGKMKRIVKYAAVEDMQQIEESKDEEDLDEQGLDEQSEMEDSTDASAEEEVKELNEESVNSSSPRMTLNADKVTVKVGENVNRIGFVQSIVDDKDSANDLWKKIQIVGDEFNSNVPGTYEQIFYVVDSDGNKSNEAKMTITVQ